VQELELAHGREATLLQSMMSKAKTGVEQAAVALNDDDDDDGYLAALTSTKNELVCTAPSAPAAA
jgi:hypothetical protein